MIRLSGHHLPTASSEDRLVAGRSSACGMRLPLWAYGASRRHFTVEREGAAWVLHDHSTNGTLLNGERVEHAPLMDGDVVRAGGLEILIEIL